MENYILKTGANLLNGSLSIGGSIYIDEHYIHFIPHFFNFRKKEVTIKISEIEDIEFFSNMLLIPNGLRLISAQNSYDFVVHNRQKLAEIIWNLK